MRATIAGKAGGDEEEFDGFGAGTDFAAEHFAPEGANAIMLYFRNMASSYFPHIFFPQDPLVCSL